jgi:hypothetical protein
MYLKVMVLTHRNLLMNFVYSFLNNLRSWNFNLLRIKRLSFFATAGVVLVSTTRRKFHIVKQNGRHVESEGSILWTLDFLRFHPVCDQSWLNKTRMHIYNNNSRIRCPSYDSS